jgi:hypothetical protein
MDQPADLSAGRRGPGEQPAIARALAIAGLTVVVTLVLVFGLVLALASDGGGREGPLSFSRLDSHGVDKLSRAELERFAEIRIPASATAVHSSYWSSMDTSVYIGVRLPRRAVRAFIRDGHFQGRLEPGRRTLFEPEGKELGWRLKGPAKVAGLQEIHGGLGRHLMVIYDDPQRPAVYLVAGTT